MTQKTPEPPVQSASAPLNHGKAHEAPPLELIRRVVGDNFGEQKWLYAVAIMAMVVAAGSTAASAYIMDAIFSVLAGAKDAHAPSVVTAVVLCIFAARGIAGYVQQVTLSRAGNRIVAKLQRQMFDKLLQQEMAWFDATDSSKILVRVTQSARSARTVIDILVTSGVRDTLTVIGLAGVMIWQNPTLSAIFLIVLPVALFGVRAVLGRVRLVMKEEFVSMAEITKVVQETSLGLRVIRSFGLEHLMSARVSQAASDVEHRANAIVRLESVTVPMMDILAGLSICTVVWVSVFEGRAGNPDAAGKVMAFITALLMAYEPAKRLSRVRVTLESAMVGVRMMLSILDRPDAMIDRPDARPLVCTKGKVAFRNVTFGYQNRRDVLKNLSIDFTPGKITAIVGPSGGGKSTVMSLLLRVYDPLEGSVEIDGMDLRGVTRASLRDCIAYAGQATFLFGTTVRENLRMGRADATDAEIEQAAHTAQAHDFIMALPQGYDTQVGENGARLSGGQRQRLSLARAVLKDAPILLMDEATSALDNKSEGLVRDAIVAATRGRTTILIAHRLSTVLAADEVVYIEAGRVVERGPLAELMGGDTRFAAMFGAEARQKEAPAHAS